MKFVHTLSAAKTVEEKTWAVADGLVQDFKDAGVDPGVLQFKEAAEALLGKGFDYDPHTLSLYWRTASTFGKSRRRSSVPLTTYRAILAPLWNLLDPATRANDLVGYVTQFLAGEDTSVRAAEKWAKAQGEALRAEQRAEEEARQKKQYKLDLKVAEAELNEALTADDTALAKAKLMHVNSLRSKLGLPDLKIDFAAEEPKAEEDEESAEERRREREEAAAEEERRYALSLWDKDLAVLSIQIRKVGNTYSRVRDDLNEDDREAAVADLDKMVARIQVLSNDLSGSINEEDLQAALSDWASES